MHCKDCKFWEHHTDQWKKSWTECSWYENKTTDSGFDIHAEADDDSGLNVSFRTGPMFGCIKFVAKTIKADKAY